VLPPKIIKSGFKLFYWSVPWIDDWRYGFEPLSSPILVFLGILPKDALPMYTGVSNTVQFTFRIIRMGLLFWHRVIYRLPGLWASRCSAFGHWNDSSIFHWDGTDEKTSTKPAFTNWSTWPLIGHKAP